MTDSLDNKINTDQFPRENSVIHNFHNDDALAREKSLKKYKRLNKYFTIPLYRARILPLFGVGKIILLLKTRGWKTGKTRRTPLEYRRYDNKITIFSGRGEEATWLKNMCANPDDVIVRHGFHHFKPELEFISDIEQKIEIMKWYVTNFGKAAKVLFGWDSKKDNVEVTDFSRLVEMISIIHLKKANRS